MTSQPIIDSRTISRLCTRCNSIAGHDARVLSMTRLRYTLQVFNCEYLTPSTLTFSNHKTNIYWFSPRSI